MKKLILLVFVFFTTNAFSYIQGHTPGLSETLIASITSSLQPNFVDNSNNINFGFDNNITFILINAGVNINTQNSPIVFAGIGLGSLIQVQYGKPIGIRENLIRVRLDFPLFFHFDDKSILNYTYFGFYFQNSDKLNSNLNSFGLSFSINSYRIIDKLSR